MSAVLAYAPGIYPRSEALVQVTRDLDRGRAEPADVERQVAADRGAFVAAQQQAGLDLLADGMLTWQDLFRPFVERTQELETGALTRFLDTNTFYRAPTANGTVRRAQPLGEEFLPSLPGERVITFPSPFAFGRAAGIDSRDVAARVLAPALEGIGAELVVLSEPLLAREPDPDLGELVDAIEALSSPAPIALQLTFGDAGPLLGQLADLPVAGIGVDFYATAVEAVPEDFPKLLLAGVIDARSSVIEQPGDIAEFASRLSTHAAADIALVPNGDLQFVSEPVARKKIGVLGAAKQELS